MLEAWTADLEYAAELGISRSSIVAGALSFVVNRGTALWFQRTWFRALLASIAVMLMVVVIPGWLIPLAAITGAVLWISFASTRVDHPKD